MARIGIRSQSRIGIKPLDGRPRGHLLTEQKARDYQFGGESFTQEDEDRFIKPLLENEEKKQKAASTQQGTPAMSEFEDKQPLGIPTDELHKEEDFPLDAFPNVMQRYIRSVAESINVPERMVALPLLVEMAGVIGSTKELEIYNGRCENVSLWAMYIAELGEKNPPY